MIVYRIAREEFANKLNCSGRPNRWNVHAQNVIYSSGSIALCALELLAHTNGIRPSGVYKIMHIKIEIEQKIIEITQADLPKDWQGLSAYPVTQQLGSSWYQSRQSLLLKIPSAIIPSESNFVINTEHEDFKSKVGIKSVTDFIWDHRFPEN